MTRHITICGAFGGVNLGDEAIAQTMRLRLGQAFPQAEFALICTVRRDVLGQNGYAMAATQVASRQDWRQVVAWLRAGPLVIGGGQMLNGARSAKGLLYLVLVATIARLAGQPVFLLGVGTRSVEKFALSRWAMRRLAQAANVIRVRDDQSRAALLACGVDGARITVTADVVFTGSITAPMQTTARKGVLFAVHQSPLVKHYTAPDFARFCAAVAHLRGQDGVQLLCHDVRPGFDLDFARQVAAVLQSAHGLSAAIVAPKSVAEAMVLYGQTDLIISSRMHPLIMGLVAGAQVLALGGAGKVADLTQRFGSFAPLGVGAQPADIAAALRPATEGGQILAGVPSALRDLAEANFADLARSAP